MHGMPLARSFGGNLLHTAILGAISGEPGPVEVPHADQMIGFHTTALVSVLLVDAHLSVGVAC